MNSYSDCGSCACGRPTVLVVDDSPQNLSLMRTVMEDHYRMIVATSGEKALQRISPSMLPDLILLDITMPQMDGYELCRRLKANELTKNIPIIFLTARTDIADEKKGLELGAVDYITKPISQPIVLARISTHLKLKAAADFLRNKNVYLEQVIDQRTTEVQKFQDVLMLCLASLAETRDNETGNHIRRTQHYVQLLANRLREHPRFGSFLTDNAISILFKAAPLHDIGKVGIPDRILLKPGPLSPQEFAIMKTHTTLGKESIERAESALGSYVPSLKIVKEIALFHHERWDGTGYPQQLAGDEIPIAARLMAIADVYDAIISRRVYKAPCSHAEAVRIIAAERGRQFDPDVADAFLAAQDDVNAIARHFADKDYCVSSGDC